MNGGTVNHLTNVDSHEHWKIVAVGQTETALKENTVDTTPVKRVRSSQPSSPPFRGLLSAVSSLSTYPTKNNIFMQTKHFFFKLGPQNGYRVHWHTMQHFAGMFNPTPPPSCSHSAAVNRPCVDEDIHYEYEASGKPVSSNHVPVLWNWVCTHACAPRYCNST